MSVIQQVKGAFKFSAPVWIIGAIVVFGWQGLEYLMEGEVTPRTVDNVIAILLTISLWFNYETLKKSFKPKKRL